MSDIVGITTDDEEYDRNSTDYNGIFVERQSFSGEYFQL